MLFVSEGFTKSLRERPTWLLGSRTSLDHHRFASERVYTFSAFTSRNVTTNQCADDGETNTLTGCCSTSGVVESLFKSFTKICGFNASCASTSYTHCGGQSGVELVHERKLI